MTLRYHIKLECAYSTSMCYVHTNIDIKIYIYIPFTIYIYMVLKMDTFQMLKLMLNIVNLILCSNLHYNEPRLSFWNCITKNTMQREVRINLRAIHLCIITTILWLINIHNRKVESLILISETITSCKFLAKHNFSFLLR